MKTIGEPIFSTEKFDVSTVWLRKRRRRNRSSNFKILLKYTRLYCEYSSLVGCRYLVESGRNWLERIVWIVIHATSLVFLIFIVLEVYKQYKTTPVLTVLETDHYPATLLHFPAVAICTINRISQQSAHEIANEVFNTNVSKLSLDEITGLFHEFGAMYDTDFNTNAERIKILQEMFTKAYGQFDVAQMMKRLTPKCSDILIKCKFSGRTRDCSKLFSFRKTQDGFCCTFNYAREQDDLPVQVSSIVLL
ncbi:sodium channel protein Nach-like [Prorops nasuta]|uniref:sodium channel protein Nach-like n=1 Tax=Prorops nasuta TaxID=863751 RepID=UPI0034CDE38A